MRQQAAGSQVASIFLQALPSYNRKGLLHILYWLRGMVGKSTENLTLRLASQRDVDAEAFLDVFKNTLEVLKEINKEVSEHGETSLQWRIVDAGMNSPIFATITGVSTGRSNTAYCPRVIESFVRGVAHLKNRNTCPPDFNENALTKTAALFRSASRGVTGIEYRSSDLIAHATKSVSENANHARRVLEHERIKRSGKYVEFGTIEGELKQLTGLANEDKIIIEDELTGHKVSCYFKNASLDSVVRRAWKSRVSVTGEITVDRLSGEYERVDVEENGIRILRNRSDLPQIDDIAGIDITGGVESSEYVRGLRDVD
jgi:hypothetical protein